MWVVEEFLSRTTAVRVRSTLQLNVFKLTDALFDGCLVLDSRLWGSDTLILSLAQERRKIVRSSRQLREKRYKCLLFETNGNFAMIERDWVVSIDTMSLRSLGQLNVM